MHHKGSVSNGNAFVAAFNDDECAPALIAHSTYMCNGNLFWLDLTTSVQHGVPISITAIGELINAYFQTPPTVFPQVVTVGLLDSANPKSLFGSLQRISPEEIIYAFLLGASRDLVHNPDEERVSAWRQCCLNVPMQFQVAVATRHPGHPVFQIVRHTAS